MDGIYAWMEIQNRNIKGIKGCSLFSDPSFVSPSWPTLKIQFLKWFFCDLTIFCGYTSCSALLNVLWDCSSSADCTRSAVARAASISTCASCRSFSMILFASSDACPFQVMMHLCEKNPAEVEFQTDPAHAQALFARKRDCINSMRWRRGRDSYSFKHLQKQVCHLPRLRGFFQGLHLPLRPLGLHSLYLHHHIHNPELLPRFLTTYSP